MLACQSWVKLRGSSKILIVQSLTMSAQSRQSEWQNIKDRTQIWQQYLVTVSEDILTNKYRINLRQISLLSFDTELDNNTNTGD